MKSSASVIIGIDATNIRAGGGVTHLVELLNAASPEAHGFDKIVVWGCPQTLDKMDSQSWLVKHTPAALSGGMLRRSLWQAFSLSNEARREGCSILFIPGGTYVGNFKPVVTLSQNLLPFESQELMRFGWSMLTGKLLLLRLTQSRTFCRSTGVIFLTEYARAAVSRVTGELSGITSVVPHGLNPRFHRPPKAVESVTASQGDKSINVVYVSIIDQYKHQWHVVEAASMLRRRGVPIELNLIGPSYKPSLDRLNRAIDKHNPDRSWVTYHGAIPFEDLHRHYAEADIGLFASSCENMPNILMEMMASGLPIACSNKGPMPEILGEAGLYFHPERPEEIAEALNCLIASPNERSDLALNSYGLSKQYTWQRCAAETFNFLNLVLVERKGNN